ncbi:MAG: response regulator [Granulosicoccus sp.]
MDDDDVSVMAIQRSMKRLNLVNPTIIAKDGVEALQILHDSIGADNTLPPFIITLDLSMPKMGGLEFLSHIRDNPVFKKLVIFVLTTSDAPNDIAQAYEKNIAGYIVKENPTVTFQKSLSMLNDYAQLVVLPS